MNWIEISIGCDGEGAEAVGELFNRLNSGPDGRGGAITELTGFDSLGELTQPAITVRTYVPADDEGRALCRRMEEGLWHLSQLLPMAEPAVRELAETDWAEAWKKHYRPLCVGERLVITPSWLTPEARPGDLVIRLDPGMAFGSGLHPSTRLCLALLEEQVQAGDHVLDLGTGSGILAIAAARLGAASVLARDIDRVAVQVAGENVEVNGASPVVRVEEGSLPDLGSEFGVQLRCEQLAAWQSSGLGVASGRPDGPWDVVVVNILAEVIVELLGHGLARTVAPGGRLILAGIIQPRAGAVQAALLAQGMAIAQRLEEGDWVALLATHGAAPARAGSWPSG
jgi:ribosomal protein L11 methyltransferase